MIADGGDALTHLATLRDQAKLFGAVASEPTAWRAVDRVDDAHLSELRAVRATARERAWAAAGRALVATIGDSPSARMPAPRADEALRPPQPVQVVHAVGIGSEGSSLHLSLILI